MLTNSSRVDKFCVYCILPLIFWMYVPWKMLLADFLMEIYSVTPISLCQVLMIYWRICVCNVHVHRYVITTLILEWVAYLNLIYMTPGFQCPNILLVLHLICEYIDFGMPSAMGGFSIFNWFFEVTTFALCLDEGKIGWNKHIWNCEVINIVHHFKSLSFLSHFFNWIVQWWQVSGKPIKLVGRGERMEDLEPFYPDRMAGRILGMGDVLSFVEKAQQVVSLTVFLFCYCHKTKIKYSIINHIHCRCVKKMLKNCKRRLWVQSLTSMIF